MKLQLLAFITFFLFVNSAVADRCLVSESKENFSAFPQTYSAAKALGKELCLQHFDPGTNNSEAIKREAEAWRALAKAESASLKSKGIDLTKIIDHIHEEIVNGEPFITLEVSKSPQLFYNASDGIPNPIEDNNKCLELEQGLNCYETLNQFHNVTKIIIALTNVETLNETYENLNLLSNAWSEYFTKARSQTFIELSLNTYLYRKELQEGQNVPPPDYQVILFHPTAAMEYIHDAPDGEQLKEALVMEWFGINFWNTRVPIGASLITSYSDRASLEDQGLGIMVHINNVYSIAYTDRDGGDGILFTFDLLKLYEDKETNLENYKTKIKDYIQ